MNDRLTKLSILLLMLGMALIPLNDSLIKLLSSRYPLAQIVVIRALFCILVISIIGKGAKKVLLLPRRTVILFAIRGMCLVVAAISYAIFQIFTRSLKSDGNLPALITIQHLCYFFSALPLLAFNWSGGLSSTGNMSFDFLLRATVSPTFIDIVYIAICAGAVLFLSLASSFAYRNVEASLIAPFEYVAIPVSVVWGILIWGDYPSSTAWVGMSLIISSGIYVIYRERINQVETTSSVPMPGSAGMVQNKKDD
ncbi:MAG: DMT family transporter [Rhodobacterales bacterium]|nr:DMT family transporter [Rhodobacterales bacterium]